MSSSDIDINVDNYNLDELYDILDITENSCQEEIIEKTNNYIEQFHDEKKKNLVEFFQDVKARLLNQIKKKDEFLSKQYERQINEEDNPIKLPEFKNKSLNPRDINTTKILLNIDSAFRKNISEPTSNFNAILSEPLTDVVSLELNSIELKHCWYSFDNNYGNTSFFIDYYYQDTNVNNCYNKERFCVCIPNGNYVINNSSNNTNNPNGMNNLIEVINSNISTLFTSNTNVSLPNGNEIEFTYDQSTHKTSIVNNHNQQDTFFEIIFYDSKQIICGSNECLSNSVCSNCRCVKYSKINSNLGWNLGFRPSEDIINTNENLKFSVFLQTSLGSPNLINKDCDYPDLTNINITNTITSNTIVDIYGPKYLLLVIDEYARNRVSKNCIGISNESLKVDLPKYYNNEKRTVNGVIQNTDCSVEPGSETQINYLYQSYPRKFSKAQLYTINQIKKENSELFNNAYNSPQLLDTIAKIPVKISNTNSFENMFEQMIEFTNGESLFTNKREYKGPVNIERLKISVTDEKGNHINFNNFDWSFTLVANRLYSFKDE